MVCYAIVSYSLISYFMVLSGGRTRAHARTQSPTRTLGSQRGSGLHAAWFGRMAQWWAPGWWQGQGWGWSGLSGWWSGSGGQGGGPGDVVPGGGGEWGWGGGQSSGSGGQGGGWREWGGGGKRRKGPEVEGRYSRWPVEAPRYPNAGEPLSFNAMQEWATSVGCSV